ncbi:hypothetical protein COU91_01320 [Candidatus Saccharibacteria bacterium CG10_big_fil_rev_8_21_14_0_10_47_8]|nr:MAG: hypothetical protein COU91_01320 [Candidatus Saccharibacteria bacterium CG10_big_fil_rev_8_21_14_0_10_47_8]
MALRNAFGDLASDESIKKINAAQSDGSQKSKLVDEFGNTVGTTASALDINIKSGSLAPSTTGGLSVYRNISLAASGVNIKSSAGQVYGWYLFNNTASVRYVKLYNKATHPSVGGDTPFMTIALPAGAGANVHFTTGIAFSNGIGIGATTGVADGDTGAPAANEVIANIIYF